MSEGDHVWYIGPADPSSSYFTNPGTVQTIAGDGTMTVAWTDPDPDPDHDGAPPLSVYPPGDPGLSSLSPTNPNTP